VIKNSCRGPSDALSKPFKETAKYHAGACNSFCREILDYDLGDELFQIGRVNIFALLRNAKRLMNR
jgi:hypothetical protein